MKKMKKHYLIMLILGMALTATIPVKGQTSISTTASDEYSALAVALHAQEGAELSGITDLTVTGSINAIDFRFLRDSLSQLTKLDLGGCTIAEYRGRLGTATDQGGISNDSIVFPADAIPHCAFYILVYDWTLNDGMGGYDTVGFRNSTILVLPTSTKSIMTRGFYQVPYEILDLSNLTALESVGDYAFSGSQLKKVIFPVTNTLTFMGEKVFMKCPNIDTIKIPQSVDSLSCGQYTGSFVAGCGNLKAFIFENGCSIKALPSEFFAGRWDEPTLDSFTYFKLPASIVTLGTGDKALENTFFTYIDCDPANTVYESKDGALYRKDGAIVAIPRGGTNFTVPATTTVIPESFFFGSRISNITFEDISTLEEIGNSAFSGCTMTSFDFPACTSLKRIGNSAFENTNISSADLSDMHSDLVIGNNVFKGTKHLATADLSGISNMSSYMFDASGIKTITFGDKITKIPDGAFSNCDSLLSIDLSTSSIDTINGYTFNNCKNLTSVTLPTGIKFLGVGAFQSTKISTLQIPANLMLGNSGSGYVLGSIKVNVDAANPYYSSQDGMLYNKNGNMFLYAPSSTDSAAYNYLAIPEGVDSIGAGAFSVNTNRYISKAALPSTLKYIPNNALSGLANTVTIICNAVTPPECIDPYGYGSNALGNNYGFGDVKNVYIPANTLRQYIAAGGWKYYHAGIYTPTDTSKSRYYDRDETDKIIVGTEHELGDVPQNFTAQADAGSKTVNIAWEAPESFGHNYTYEILRNNVALDTVDGDEFSYIDNNLPDGTYYYQVNALYTYTDVDYNGKTDSVEVVVSFSVGNSILNENSRVVVYPNPTSDVVTVSTSCKIIRIYDMRGTLLASINGSRADMRSFPTGTYIFEITTAEGKIVTAKITKK